MWFMQYSYSCLLKYNSHNIKPTLLKYIIQYFLIQSESCTNISAI